jgi:pyruvate dehydrogenase (quinone)
MSRQKVADLVVETLAAAGVRRIYGVAGDSLNAITDAIRRREGVQWVHVRHEEAAAFAAGADAHVTGGLAACAGSCGPGHVHLINGLYDCHRSRVPVVVIAAHIPSKEVGTGYFQETHPEVLFRECSHYCELVAHPEQMPRVLDIAVRTALERRGVSVIVLPGDVAQKNAEFVPPRVPPRRTAAVVRPSAPEVAELAGLLNAAKKVTILGGAGCAGAREELITLAGKLKAPIVHAMRGKEYIEPDNPFDVGMTGLLGFASGYRAMLACDTLLMLGTDFPYPQFYPEHARIIQVDVRGEQIGRRTRVDLGLVGDVAETIRALLPAVAERVDRAHLDDAVRHYREARRGLDELATGQPGRKPIHPQYVAKVLDEVAADDAIFACDVGTPTVWAARYLRMNGKRRLLGSFTHGSMANALPQAIGAQLAYPGRQVVTLSGDGGMAMLMGELLTLRQVAAPVKLVVFNNSSLGFVELEMKAAGILDYATDLQNPNFAKLADACGLLGVRAEDPAEVRPTIEHALRHDGPALVDVVVNRQELSMPPSINVAEAMGFGLYLIKAVLNGRGDEVIDLARTNLFR